MTVLTDSIGLANGHFCLGPVFKNFGALWWLEAVGNIADGLSYSIFFTTTVTRIRRFSLPKTNSMARGLMLMAGFAFNLFPTK